MCNVYRYFSIPSFFYSVDRFLENTKPLFKPAIDVKICLISRGLWLKISGFRVAWQKKNKRTWTIAKVDLSLLILKGTFFFQTYEVDLISWSNLCIVHRSGISSGTFLSFSFPSFDGLNGVKPG